MMGLTEVWEEETPGPLTCTSHTIQHHIDFTQKTAVLRFLAHEGLGATYNFQLRLIGECVVDFLLVLIELFSPGLTAETLQANISSKSVILIQREPVYPKFQVE